MPPYLPAERSVHSGLTFGLDGGNVGSDRAELADDARCRLAIQRFASLVALTQVCETVNGGLDERGWIRPILHAQLSHATHGWTIDQIQRRGLKS